MDDTAPRLERATRHLDSDVYRAAGLGLGLEVDVVDARRNFVVIRSGDRAFFVKDNRTSAVDAALRQVVNSKLLTNRHLAAHGLPVPECVAMPVRDLEGIKAYVQGRNRAVVIKPNGASLARGVTRKPRSDAEIEGAVAKLRRMRNAEALIEDFAYGAGYRALVCRGEVLDVLTFHGPTVTGDGVHTLAELITLRDRWKKARGLKRAVVEPLCLRAQRLYEWEVLPPGCTCELNPNEDLTVGGEWERLALDRVHPDNLAMFAAVARACDLPVCGIDYLSPDIARPFTENGGVVHEVNSAPNIYIHYYIGEEEDLGVPMRLLDRYFAGD